MFRLKTCNNTIILFYYIMFLAGPMSNEQVTGHYWHTDCGYSFPPGFKEVKTKG